MPTLAQTQQLLWKLITAPEGATAGLARLDPVERAIAASLVRPGGRLSPVARLEIYADMYFYRLRDCLQEDFATVCAVIGAARFHNLITDYLLVHPPTHFSLRYAGQHLPGFIGGYALSAEWPFLQPLAALEWAIVDAFDAPDATPMELGVLQEIPAGEWPTLRFGLTPSLRLLHVDWRVDELWRRVQDGCEPATPEEGPTWLRVWRQDLRVFHRPIDAAEAVALEAIANDEPFAGVCAAVGELLGESAGAEQVVELLAIWFADGLVTNVRRGDAVDTPDAPG